MKKNIFIIICLQLIFLISMGFVSGNISTGDNLEIKFSKSRKEAGKLHEADKLRGVAAKGLHDAILEVNKPAKDFERLNVKLGTSETGEEYFKITFDSKLIPEDSIDENIIEVRDLGKTLNIVLKDLEEGRYFLFVQLKSEESVYHFGSIEFVM